MHISEDYIDSLANNSATSPTNSIPDPSEAQLKSGNYKKGHLRFHGLDISIENPAGSIRSGMDKEGNKWSTKFKGSHYGYIRGTDGKDGDQLDVFIGPDRDSQDVYVVNQKKKDSDMFDEVKIMLGFSNFKDAVHGYLINYEKGWNNILSIHRSDIDKLKNWIKTGNTRTKYTVA